MIGESRGGNYWRPASDRGNACDTGVLAIHNDGINISHADGHVKWYPSIRVHAPRALVTSRLPWTNTDTYASGW
jgi:prepilin-type processing-associated H-X9-DG protein